MLATCFLINHLFLYYLITWCQTEATTYSSFIQPHDKNHNFLHEAAEVIIPPTVNNLHFFHGIEITLPSELLACFSFEWKLLGFSKKRVTWDEIV